MVTTHIHLHVILNVNLEFIIINKLVFTINYGKKKK